MRGVVAVLGVLVFAVGMVAADHGGPGGWQPVQDQLAGVPCTVPTVDDTTSANLKLLSRLSFSTGGLHGEVDIRGHLALVARYGASDGFEIVDVGNPLSLSRLATTTGVTGGLDVKFSPDGQTAIVGNHNGVNLVDVRNPSAPVKVGQWNFPGTSALEEAHMVHARAIAGEQWVFIGANGGTGVWILKLQGPPEQRTLVKVAQTLPVEGGPLGPHDMWSAFDADLGKWLLYVADGTHSWTVFDVSNPASPMFAGGFDAPSAGYVHTVQAAKVGDRRLVATIEEVGVNILKVYDASNLLAPLLLAQWQAHPGTGSVDPQHNLQIVQGKLYMAHYRQGLYVFDLGALGPLPLAGSLDLKPVAHFAGSGGSGVRFDDFWDLVLDDGILYGSDQEDGLFVVGYGCNTPGEATLTSTG